uniref:Uncharacterized protein n=1 Tax=Leersia perrieri TaxID=77586 RepID=A0A0D9XL34_9ORYZ
MSKTPSQEDKHLDLEFAVGLQRPSHGATVVPASARLLPSCRHLESPDHSTVATLPSAQALRAAAAAPPRPNIAGGNAHQDLGRSSTLPAPSSTLQNWEGWIRWPQGQIHSTAAVHPPDLARRDGSDDERDGSTPPVATHRRPPCRRTAIATCVAASLSSAPSHGLHRSRSLMPDLATAPPKQPSSSRSPREGRRNSHTLDGLVVPAPRARSRRCFRQLPARPTTPAPVRLCRAAACTSSFVRAPSRLLHAPAKTTSRGPDQGTGGSDLAGAGWKSSDRARVSVVTPRRCSAAASEGGKAALPPPSSRPAGFAGGRSGGSEAERVGIGMRLFAGYAFLVTWKLGIEY